MISNLHPWKQGYHAPGKGPPHLNHRQRDKTTEASAGRFTFRQWRKRRMAELLARRRTVQDAISRPQEAPGSILEAGGHLDTP